MKTYTDNLLVKMQEQLTEIVFENYLQYAKESLTIVRCKVEELKTFIRGYTFENKAEEIIFFKHVVPVVYAKLIYYMRLYKLELQRPYISKRCWKRLLENEKKPMDKFFNQHMDFYAYYNSGNTTLDAEYFTRGGIYSNSTPDEIVEVLDENVITLYSFKLSQLLAYSELQTYFDNNLALIEQKQIVDQALPQKELPEWSASKIDLIELAYAIFATGVLGRTHLTLKGTITFFETIFKTSLGNYSSAFQRMTIRKKNRTVFMDRLKEKLEAYMNSLYEK